MAHGTQILLDCPSCSVRLSFTTASRLRRGAPLHARCPGCGASYDLLGGDLRRTDLGDAAHWVDRHPRALDRGRRQPHGGG
ncbi:MAG TPA: hypothetical protein VHK88_16045 [Aquihabitans sp.]|nr:hypothetical protein [Aquihabitans sp.]